MKDVFKPQIFTSETDAPKDAKLVDAFTSAIDELFFIDHPQFKKQMPEAQTALAEFQKNHGVKPIWIFYPYYNVVVRTVPEDIYFKLRTARNKNIITAEEQTSYRNSTVGIAGLSVGSAILTALTISGGPKNIKIADFYTVEITNLNRIRAKLVDVGLNKAHIAARETWDVDPFSNLILADQGVNKDNISDFILGSPKLDIFIDEMDSIDAKIMARLICKENKIPVLMATDNGDGVILDVERYDLEPDRSIFHGRIGDMKAEDVANLDFKAWLPLAAKIVGLELHTERMEESLVELGKSIASVPQLGTTATLAGSAMAFAVRRITNKEPLDSGKYVFGLEENLVPGYNSQEAVDARAAKTQAFLEKFMGKK